MRIPRWLNFFHIGLCNWGTNFNLGPCDLPRGHAGLHHVRAATGLPPTLTTRKEQEDWVRDHRPPWAGGKLWHGPRSDA